MPKTIADLKRSVPVYAEVDVLVCGGGPAGFSAAIASARAGASTLLVEQTNCLGGIATAGGHNHFSQFTEHGPRRVVGGISWEAMQRVIQMGYGAYAHSCVDFELEGLKLVLEQMTAQAGAKTLYHTLFADAIVDDGAVVGAFIQNKSGRQAVLARRVIDATGDADVAASAGAPWEMGRSNDGAVQPCTLMFQIGGVDMPKLKAWRTDYQMKDIWKAAQRNGDMEPFQSTIMGFWWTPTRPDQIGVNFTHLVGCDPTSADSITAATIEGRRQAFHMIPVFRKYVPGMEQCYLISTAALLGTRESRRIIGPVVLTEDDLKAMRTWEDSIGYGSFFIDVHNCTGPGMDAETWRPPEGFKYQIPYRVILPQKARNLLVAGRCISVTHVALGSTRIMSTCAVLGEAAGAAAALSLRANCPPDKFDAAELQDHLRKQGAIIDEAGIAPG